MPSFKCLQRSQCTSKIHSKAHNLCPIYLSALSSTVSVHAVIQNHSIEVCLECVLFKGGCLPSRVCRGPNIHWRYNLRLRTTAYFMYQQIIPVLSLSSPSPRTIVLRCIKHVSSSKDGIFLLRSAEVREHLGDTAKSPKHISNLLINNFQSCFCPHHYPEP